MLLCDVLEKELKEGRHRTVESLVARVVETTNWSAEEVKDAYYLTVKRGVVKKEKGFLKWKS